MASGEEAKKQFSILDTGVQVDLPDHFCLERPENDKVHLYCTPCDSDPAIGKLTTNCAEHSYF